MTRTGFRPTLHFRRGEDGVFSESDASALNKDCFWYYPAYGGTFWYPEKKGILMVATDSLSDEEFNYIYTQLSDCFDMVEVLPGLLITDTSVPATPIEDWELFRD